MEGLDRNCIINLPSQCFVWSPMRCQAEWKKEIRFRDPLTYLTLLGYLSVSFDSLLIKEAFESVPIRSLVVSTNPEIVVPNLERFFFLILHLCHFPF